MEYDEQNPNRSAYRAHMRTMTEARQAAEKARKAQSRDPAVRKAITQTYNQEMVRIDEEHWAWLRVHGVAEPPRIAKRAYSLPGDHLVPEPETKAG